MSAKKVRVTVDGVELTLSNLDKVLYPRHGFAKGEVIDYYTRVAPYLVPHLANRPSTRKRYPDGVNAEFFFEKNAPAHTPDWVRTVRLPAPGSTKGRETVDYVVIDDLPTLVWSANLAAIELHIPQWRVKGVGKGARGPRGAQGGTARRRDGEGAARDPELLVYDLDPGPPATLVQSCRVARLLRDLLDADGLVSYPKTSGKKGLHLYVPIREVSDERTSAYAKESAQRLQSEYPDLVVSRMEKRLRPGKVFVDWSQNNAHKTTVAAYSLRAAEEPTVSTPVTWEEVEACEDPRDLYFTAEDVLARVEEHGDLLEALLDKDRQKLP